MKKLQVFLKNLEGFSDLAITGVYDDATIAATDAFQIRYKADILLPWGYDGTTGTDYTYILTKKKVNEIYCQRAFPVTAQQQAEIDATKAFFDQLRAEGIDVNHNANTGNTGNTGGNNGTGAPLLNDVVGLGGTATSTPETGGLAWLGTLGNLSSTTRASLIAGVVNAGKAFGRNVYSWLILFVVLAIIAVGYLWYLEYKKNKQIEEDLKIEALNKEIDLNK